MKRSERNPFIRQIVIVESFLAGSLSVIFLILLCLRAAHAGALWRYEAGALQLATLPTFAEVTRSFQHEAFPLLFPATVRAYVHFFGRSDAALRFFGLAVGIGFMLAAWFVMPRPGKPLLQLGLVRLNTTFLVWGTSIRGYGLGSVLILITLGFAIRALQHPGFFCPLLSW